MTKLRRYFNDEIKKINENKKFDFSKEMSLVFERKEFINDICRSRNKNYFVNQIYMI